MNKKYHIWTSGCQMNVHDSEKIGGIFSEMGYEKAEGFNKADVVVLNTCSIREKAEQKFYSELGRLKKVKKHNPDIKIAVAGCIAQQKGTSLFKRFPYVDFIFGPNNIDKLQSWIDQNAERRIQNAECRTQNTECRTQRIVLTDNFEYHTKKLPVKREGRVKAWVSIMYGCNNFCAYCVVPYTRGRERSRPSKDIYDEIKGLSDKGFREITLLGQNVNSYGKTLDENIDFSDLLRRIHEIDGIRRIRFVTSHPRDFSGKLILSIHELPKVCEHVHLPIQSGSDRILNLMNRGYRYDTYKTKIDALRNRIPGVAITTDIIAGFPGESEEEFEMTVKALSDIEFDGIFAFKYSRRPDTKALSLPDHVNEDVKSQRLKKILELQEGITYKKNRALEGRECEVLAERVSESDSNILTGRTRTNKIVNFAGVSSDIGTFVKVIIKRAQQHSLSGEKVLDLAKTKDSRQ